LIILTKLNNSMQLH